MEQSEGEHASVRAASDEISQQLETLVNADDLTTINNLQHLILGRLQDSNAVLSHFNEYSEQCFLEVSGDFSRNTRLLKSMKSDLDYIFQKLSWVSGYRIRAYLLSSFNLSLNLSWTDLKPKDGYLHYASMKAKLLATYPDAFQDGSTPVVHDQRPDLERPQ